MTTQVLAWSAIIVWGVLLPALFGRYRPRPWAAPSADAPTVGDMTTPAFIAYLSLDQSGEAHAAPVDGSLTFCGAVALSFAGRPWPVFDRLWGGVARCPACAAVVYGA